MARVPASETTRKRLNGLFGGEFDKSELMREAIRLIIEETLEAEVSEHLQRGYYERGEAPGYRNATGQEGSRAPKAWLSTPCHRSPIRFRPG